MDAFGGSADSLSRRIAAVASRGERICIRCYKSRPEVRGRRAFILRKAFKVGSEVSCCCELVISGDSIAIKQTRIGESSSICIRETVRPFLRYFPDT